MRPSCRGLSFAIALGWATVLVRPGVADEPKDRMRPGHCGCSEGKACWHYLRSPLKPPEDPCRCGLCFAKGDCSTKDRPDGWSGECMGSQRPACFWKRHAASWEITCAACAADRECAACDEVAHLPLPADVRDALEKQLRVEGNSARKKTLVAWTPRFYVATDLPHLKLLTQGGGPRVADQHEIVHLFLERAEKAYDDFVEVWGHDVSLGKPMGIFLAERKSRKEEIQSAYFGGARTDMIYGGGLGHIAGGFCWNGFALAADEENSDRDLHAHVRHMIGHILFSCWHGVTGQQKNAPKWAFAGVADWLCKIDPLFVDWTVVCQDEGPGPSVQADHWFDRARKVAAGKHDPIEKMFAIPSLSSLSFDDLVRSWSYMSLMLAEDRERWLATMRLIREGTEHAVAFQKGLGMTPDEFDKRWVERMTGRRRSMADTPKDVASADDGGGTNATERKRIREEPDLLLLAALLRGLDRVTDVRTADAVLSRLSTDSDLVRETIVILLSKTESKEVVADLAKEGLSDGDSVVRGFVARILGNLKAAEARPALEALLDDPHWLARANAARALADVADPASLPALLARMEDANPKAWIAKADALATFGQAASKASVPVANGLDASDWQVRLSACRALAKLGDKDCVDALIERLDTEGGRLRREIHAALKAVTHENFGAFPQTWRNWWKTQKPRGIPPELPPSPEDDRYAKPKPIRPEEPAYYGRRVFSQSVLFVIDVSKSMDAFIHIPPEASAKLGNLTPGPRIMVAKSAVIQAIQKLDPRARFNVVFFSTKVRPWQKTLVQASDAMKADAISDVQRAPLEEETNVYGALRAAVGLHEKPTLAADLDPIPDTIYFMTDGTPTRGEITDTETILSWMRDVNRFAKVELHVIAMGNLGVDLPFLERLATENAGEFIHVPED